MVVLERGRGTVGGGDGVGGTGGGDGDVTDQGDSPGNKSKIINTTASPLHLEEHEAPLQS